MPTRLRIFRTFALVALLCASAPPARADSGDGSAPRETGIVERTERRLVQIDVTVSGSPNAIRDLAAEDFELVIAGDRVEQFDVDSLCTLPDPKAEAAPAETVPAETAEDEPQASDEPRQAPPSRGATYLFFFDQNHLNPAGRQRALDVTRELIPQLIVGGSRAIIVSSAESLGTYADLTDDHDVLLQALDELENDRKQWTQWSFQEESRVEEVLKAMSDSEIERAASIARRHQQEEHWRTDKALRRFSLVLGLLADVEAPKAVVYFSDTMRKNAGGHYLSFFGNSVFERSGALNAISTASFGATSAWEHVVDEAAAHGVRLYTVQAEGIVAAPRERPAAASAGAAIGASKRRFKDAQESLVGFAMESGGRHFLNGVRPKKIAQTILEDLSCVYLLSFDAARLAEDRSLPVRVRMHRSGVKAHVRGRLVVRSEEQLLTSRLLAAFAAPDVVQSEDNPLHATLVPTGYRDGKFVALVQLVVPGSPVSFSEWDMGLSLVARGKVREDISRRVAVSAPNTPVIFETEMTFGPGPYELVAVAHEGKADEIYTVTVSGTWPDPDDAPVTVGPIAVLQPQSAAFVRGPDTRREGPLALGRDEAARVDRPTALVSIVCRGKRQKGKLKIEREIGGDSTAPFETLEFEMGDDRCVQIQDVVRAGTMTEGVFRYDVRVLRKNEELTAASHEFIAVAPDASGLVSGLE